MKSRLAFGDYNFAYVRRRGVWAPTSRLAGQDWLADWLVTGLAAAVIVTAGGLIGFYGARPRLDAESRRLADAAARAAASAWAAAPQPAGARSAGQARNEGCMGGVTLIPLPWRDPITARYTCSISSSRGEAVAAMALRDGKDGWRIASLYVAPVWPKPTGPSTGRMRP